MVLSIVGLAISFSGLYSATPSRRIFSLSKHHLLALQLLNPALMPHRTGLLLPHRIAAAGILLPRPYTVLAPPQQPRPSHAAATCCRQHRRNPVPPCAPPPPQPPQCPFIHSLSITETLAHLSVPNIEQSASIPVIDTIRMVASGIVLDGMAVAARDMRVMVSALFSGVDLIMDQSYSYSSWIDTISDGGNALIQSFRYNQQPSYITLVVYFLIEVSS